MVSFGLDASTSECVSKSIRFHVSSVFSRQRWCKAMAPFAWILHAQPGGNPRRPQQANEQKTRVISPTTRSAVFLGTGKHSAVARVEVDRGSWSVAGLTSCLQSMVGWHGSVTNATRPTAYVTPLQGSIQTFRVCSSWLSFSCPVAFRDCLREFPRAADVLTPKP